MTEVPDGSGPISRRPSRASDGGAPISGGLAIVLAVVAVVAGFLILRSISDGGDQSADFPDATSGDDVVPTGGDTLSDLTGDTTDGSQVPTLPTTSSVPPLQTEGAKVIVANANSKGGSASKMSRALEAKGFDMVDPVDASASIGDLAESRVYFDPAVAGAEAVANSVATVLGGVSTVQAMPETPPTKDGSLNGAGVLLLLGNDKADKTLEDLAPASGGTGATTPPLDTTTTSTTVAG